MTDYLDLPIGNESPEIVTAVIEIPQGWINQYEYDKKLHLFRLDRWLRTVIHSTSWTSEMRPPFPAAFIWPGRSVS
jgi:inorganic pyrophosphatase